MSSFFRPLRIAALRGRRKVEQFPFQTGFHELRPADAVFVYWASEIGSVDLLTCSGGNKAGRGVLDPAPSELFEGSATFPSGTV